MEKFKEASNINQTKRIILPSKIEKNDGVIENELEIINELNKHFNNISDIITKTLKGKMNTLLGSHVFDISYITTIEVKQIISKLNTNKSKTLKVFAAQFKKKVLGILLILA
jgi:hypothetical protein